VFADVLVATNLPAYPCRHKGNYCFPVGTFRTRLADAELRMALTANQVLECTSASWYESSELFGRWVKDMAFARLACRAKGNELSAKMIKIICLGLFGKFAQRRVRWELAPEAQAHEPFMVWEELHPLARTGPQAPCTCDKGGCACRQTVERIKIRY